MEQSQKNVPQCKISKTLNISSCTVNNIKTIQELGGSPSPQNNPIIDVHDLLVLREPSIKNMHDSVMEITAWAQEPFQKWFSVKTVSHPPSTMQIKALSCKDEGTWEWGSEMAQTSLGSFKWMRQSGQMNQMLKLYLRPLDWRQEAPSDLLAMTILNFILQLI